MVCFDTHCLVCGRGVLVVYDLIEEMYVVVVGWCVLVCVGYGVVAVCAVLMVGV